MIKKVQSIFFIFTFGINLFLISAKAELEKSNNKSIHNLPINKNNIIKNNTENLKPYPLSSINVAAKSVNSNRNPFSNLTKSQSKSILDPRLNYRLTGIALSGSIQKAILSTSNGIKFYGIGENINEEYKIKQISFNEKKVVLTNGDKDYELIINKK